MDALSLDSESIRSNYITGNCVIDEHISKVVRLV